MYDLHTEGVGGHKIGYFFVNVINVLTPNTRNALGAKSYGKERRLSIYFKTLKMMNDLR